MTHYRLTNGYAGWSQVRIGGRTYSRASVSSYGPYKGRQRTLCFAQGWPGVTVPGSVRKP